MIAFASCPTRELALTHFDALYGHNPTSLKPYGLASALLPFKKKGFKAVHRAKKAFPWLALKMIEAACHFKGFKAHHFKLGGNQVAIQA